MDLTKRPLEHELDPIEIATRDQISAVQTRRMAWSLRHTYENVPHFRARCEAQGVHPDDFRTLDDLPRFPFTTKQHLRETYPFGSFAVPLSEVVRIHASSGTTGKPTVVGYTRADIDLWATVMARSIRAGGGRHHSRIHVSYGYGLFTGGLGAHYGAEKLGATVIPVSGGQTEKQVQLIKDFAPDIIMVTPSYMLVIADAMERHGMDPRDCSLSIGLFGAEPWTDEMRAQLEQRLGIDAIDIYGLSEIIGPGVAQECIETKDGLHIWEDHFYPEIIDPETGAVLPDGHLGELVLTSLTKEAMPVVRYRTRDLTRLMPGTARSMRRMQKITGRSDDMLIIRGVNVFPSQIEELLLRDDRLSPHYQLELRRDRHLVHLTVKAELRPGLHDQSARAGAARDLQHQIKSYIGISSTVEVVGEGTLERSQGKAKRVVDLRDVE